MQNNQMVDGLSMIKTNLTICEACTFGKQTKLPYLNEPRTRAAEVLALIYSDLCGPMNTPSLGKVLYFILFMLYLYV